MTLSGIRCQEVAKNDINQGTWAKDRKSIDFRNDRQDDFSNFKTASQSFDEANTTNWMTAAIARMPASQ